MSRESPLTIEEWRIAQLAGSGLERLLSLAQAERERAANKNDENNNAWISVASDQEIRRQWSSISRLDPETAPLYGVPFAAKDNIEAGGFPPAGAACPAYMTAKIQARKSAASAAAAAANSNIRSLDGDEDYACAKYQDDDAVVISRLKAKGAVLIGKTNLDQFATGLVGTRSPVYGPVGNAFDSTRVSGGSSSGSAVVVSRGSVPFSLGTDTAGSGRVPAGLNNILGLKPTRGAISTAGVVPACRSLDCVSIFALTPEDAATVLSVAEGADEHDVFSRSRPIENSIYDATTASTLSWSSSPVLGICDTPEWFENGGDDDDNRKEVPLRRAAYEAALEQARRQGFKLVPVDFSHLFELAALLYQGPWVAERYAAIRWFIEGLGGDKEVQDAMDAVVHEIVVSGGRRYSASDLFEAQYRRKGLENRIHDQLFKNPHFKLDGLLVPTAPTFPTIQGVQSDPIRRNSQLGTYTNFVNFMDWSALAIPAGFAGDGLPFGITFISWTWHERQLLAWSQRFLESGRLLGATQRRHEENQQGEEEEAEEAEKPPSCIDLVVVGAHLRGFPLNGDLTSRGATFVQETTTSASYRLFALEPAGPSAIRKPGLKRVRSGGVKIAVEVWSLPKAQFADFFTTIPSPLGLGSVELSSGDWVPGFICEPVGLDGEAVLDVSEYGGWRSYMASLHPPVPSPTSAITSINTKPEIKDIRKVLIANRGEIAVRIIRTLREMGIASVAIYSTADAEAEHVRQADEAVHLAPDSSSSSVLDTYLCQYEVIKAARTTGCDAVIPGYGFLAENADFAELVESQQQQDQRMAWIGPTPKQMSDMGLKHAARRIAHDAQVPTVPGSGLISSADEAVEAVESVIGCFPVMVKSTAGGGGIGLKVAENEKELREGFAAVSRLAGANFGDAGVFVERFVRRARHVEVQILGDGKGNAVAVGDRDCSLQRRHQKVIEECPAVATGSESMGISIETATAMREAAIRLAESVAYRSVGTVEFIYDVDRHDFFFLEMNTRLQVEHPVTEEVFGLDLVRAMIETARGTLDLTEFRHEMEQKNKNRREDYEKNFAIEARIYAESPLQQFRPSPGKLLEVTFASGPNVRIDTWVRPGTELSSSYDPLIAKIIGTGSTRESATAHLVEALAATRITGVETNIEYVSQLVSSSLFSQSRFHTTSLDNNEFKFSPKTTVIEILDSGSSSSSMTIQDYPGRKNLWHLGIPPSGPMDSYSFRLANRIVGNCDAAADNNDNNNNNRNASLECVDRGPTLLFHGQDTFVAIVPWPQHVNLDGKPIREQEQQPFIVRRGQTLSVGPTAPYCRCYMAFGGGGIDVPVVYGSRSTFSMGGFGGHLGRGLRAGDLIRLFGEGGDNRGSYKKGEDDVREICDDRRPLSPLSPILLPHPKPDGDNGSPTDWRVAVLPGPHAAPEHFTPAGYQILFEKPWTVHYNSSRLGVRLQGPEGWTGPEWVRPDGGAAGLHPSNIDDSPYALGSVSFTGDKAVVLTADGPSLGGFVVFATVISADLWKFGQVKPGDRVWLNPVSKEQAVARWHHLETSISNLCPLEQDDDGEINGKAAHLNLAAGLLSSTSGSMLLSEGVSCQPFGDSAFLLQFFSQPTADGFDMRQTFRIAHLIARHGQSPIHGVKELVPGVRTLLVMLTINTDEEHQRTLRDLGSRLIISSTTLMQQQHQPQEAQPSSSSSWKLPSRRIRLPLAFDDSVSQAAVDRYASTIRSSAPYLPSNVEFLESLNFGSRGEKDSGCCSDGSQQLRALLESSTNLVLGLGDVYLGSPCAVPMDPRHRFFGTKYNPSRSQTPQGSVGIGGQYLCIYAAESPGGYQLAGRTVPIWRGPGSSRQDFYGASTTTVADAEAACMFNLLDRISFYPVTEAELDDAIRTGRSDDMVQVIEEEDDGMLSLSDYENWLVRNKDDIDAVLAERDATVKSAPFYDELFSRSIDCDDGDEGSLQSSTDTAIVRGESVMANIPGRCFKIVVNEGGHVEKGDPVAWIESNKMELQINSPVAGTCTQIVVKTGSIVGPTDVLVVVTRDDE